MELVRLSIIVFSLVCEPKADDGRGGGSLSLNVGVNIDSLSFEIFEPSSLLGICGVDLGVNPLRVPGSGVVAALNLLTIELIFFLWILGVNASLSWSKLPRDFSNHYEQDHSAF